MTSRRTAYEDTARWIVTWTGEASHDERVFDSEMAACLFAARYRLSGFRVEITRETYAQTIARFLGSEVAS